MGWDEVLDELRRRGGIEPLLTRSSDEFVEVSRGFTLLRLKLGPAEARFGITCAPNPFSNSVRISCQVPIAGRANIQVFDISADGRWLVLLEDDPTGDVWVLEASRGSF